jgi:hypothetical protein
MIQDERSVSLILHPAWAGEAKGAAPIMHLAMSGILTFNRVVQSYSGIKQYIRRVIKLSRGKKYATIP